MSSKNNNEHFFDQDFEVTYEDDPLFHYEEEPLTKREFQTVDLKSQPKPRASGKKKKKIQMPLQGDAVSYTHLWRTAREAFIFPPISPKIWIRSEITFF